MTRRMVTLLCLVMAATTAFAQAPFALTDTVRFNPDVKTGRLQSGIPYYVLKNGKPAGRLELMLVVNAGAVLEDDDQNGLAHFCEHMAFNGTQSFPKQELVNFLESMGVRFGADLNAYTNADETVYMLTIPLDNSKNLIKGIQVIRDWAGFVTYDEEAINAERGVIMEEWRLGKGADDRIRDKHRHAWFYGSKYAERDVIGDTNVLLRAPGENLRRFYRTWYRPENFAIVAVGDIDPISFVTVLEKYFSSPASSGQQTSNRPQIVLPKHTETIISVASDPELQGARVEVLHKHPADTVHTYGQYKKLITQQLVYEMLNERLSEMSRKNPPPFAGAGTGQFRLTRENTAAYGMAAAADRNVTKTLNALLTEFERVRRHGFTATELARAKDATMSRMEKYYNERDKSESQQFAQELTRHVLQRESVPGIVHEWEIYGVLVPTITLDDVSKAAQEMITRENRVITVSVPEGNGFTKPTEQQVRDLVAAVEAKTIEAYVDAVPTKPLLENAPTPGTITGLRTMADVGATELTLSNGARVVYKKTEFKNDEILFAARSWGGRSLTPEADHITTMVAAGLIDECGVGEHSVTDLMKLLNGKNVGISPAVSMEQEILNGSASPKDLRTLFELIYLGFTSPRKDPEAFAAWKMKTKTELSNKDKNPQQSFFDTVMTVYSNNHPRVRSMSEADVDKVDLDKAYAFMADRFKYGNEFTFYFVGNVDEEQLKKYCETYIASLPQAPSKETWKDVGIRPKKGQFRKSVYKGVEPQAMIYLSTTGSFKYTPENRYDIIALCEVMEIQLREQLREEKGGVYFVNVIPNVEKIPTEEYSISVMFGCDPTRVDELVSVVKKEFNTVRTTTVPDSVVAKVREIQTKEREVALKTNRFWMQLMTQFDADGEPYSNVFLRDEMIKKLTPARIKAAAEKYLGGPNLAEFVMQPESFAKTAGAKATTPQQSAPAPKKKGKK